MQNDYPDVVKLFLKMRQNNRAALTAIDLNGFTFAHIAAVKGSYSVIKELMVVDKAMVIQVCLFLIPSDKLKRQGI